MADVQLLRDPDIYPTNEVLKEALSRDSFEAFEELMQSVSDMQLDGEWRYYRDGKSWLCKVTYKKKTVFWLSVWDKCFKTGLHFTAKNCSGINDLDIDNRIKEEFAQTKLIGKLMSLPFDIRKKDQLPDLIKVIEYKKSLK